MSRSGGVFSPSMWRVRFLRNEIWSLDGLSSPRGRSHGLIVWSLSSDISIISPPINSTSG